MGNGRSVCPEWTGQHAGYNGSDRGTRRREAKPISKRSRSSDCGLKLARMKLDSVVIACQKRAVNTSLLLAHTARQSTRVGSG